MAQFASDSFTGVDGTTLQAHSANWVEHPSSAGGDMLITANRLQQRVSGEGFYYHSASPSSADYSVSSDFYVVSYSPAFNASGVVGRVSTSANTFYHARHRISGGWELYKRLSGTFTLLGSQTISTPAVGGTYNIKLDMVGSTIRLLADGVELVSIADASITAAGKSGLRISNASAQTTSEGFHFDNFSADEVGGGGGGTTYTITPSGAITFSGAPNLLKTKVLLPLGNISFGGTSAAIKTKILSPNGNVTLSGSSPIVKTKIVNASGTIGLTGTSPVIKSKVIEADGGITINGTASLSGAVSYILSPIGGVTFNGSSKLIKTHIQIPTGKISFSGSSPIESNTVIITVSTRLPLTGVGK